MSCTSAIGEPVPNRVSDVIKSYDHPDNSIIGAFMGDILIGVLGFCREKASKIIEKAQAAIESEKKAAMAELKSHVAGLSIDIAEKVVRGELSNKDKQVKLVESSPKFFFAKIPEQVT